MAPPLELRPRRRIENQLLRGEIIHRRVPQHFMAYGRPALWIAAGVALWVLLFEAQVGKPGMVPVVLLLLRGGWLAAQTYQDWFVVTNKRIFRIQGVFNQRMAAMPLARIVDITLVEPFLGRLGSFSYGHFIFENAAQDQGLREIRYVRGAARLNHTIQQLGLGGVPDETGEIPRVT